MSKKEEATHTAEAAAEAATPAPAAESPKQAAAEAQQISAADLYRQLLTVKADFENYRKRVDREKPEWVKLGEAGILARLLPLYDVLLQAHEQVLKASGGDGASSKELIAGLELLFKEFTKMFESEGVKIIETVGKPYDYDRHEVLGSVETNDQPEGTVVEELQKGFTFQGKVLRPARVRIAKPKA